MEKELAEVQKRQINYTIIDHLWEAIYKQGVSQGRIKESDSDFKRNNKERLYKIIGTHKTDFSSYKSGKKTKLTKTMKRAIEVLNFDDYINKNDHLDNIPKWTNTLKAIFKGELELKVQNLTREQILSLYEETTDAGDEDGKLQINKRKKEIENQIDKYCNKIAMHYWKNEKSDSGYFALCIWLAIIVVGERSKYVHRRRIYEAVARIEMITLEDLKQCDLTYLEEQIEAMEKELRRMRIVCDYRRLEIDNIQ